MKIIIDFDSTFSKVEGLDELAAIALAGKSNRETVVAEIRRLTDLGMNGEISFGESLNRRIQLLSANRMHIDALIEFLKTKISDSFVKNSEFFKNNAENIYIISGGFREFIVPVAATLGILENHVFANNFTFDGHGSITGVDENNFLARDGGKIKTIKAANLNGEICVIGDGYTDYEIRAAGLATRFYAFTENVRREKVCAVADRVINSFDEFRAAENL